MADDESAYLQSGFEPSTLTVPRLRSILVAHSVAYPSSAKKPDLIDLFNDNIAPKASKLRNAQSRTKRSTRGIVDVPSNPPSVDGADHAVDEDTVTVEHPASVRRPSRRTTRAQTEDVIQATPQASRSTRQSTAPLTAKRSSSRHARGEDTDSARDAETRRLAPRKSTKQSVSPRVGFQEESNDDFKYREGPDSPFSKENPFQSGSPDANGRSRSSDRRRTTLGQTPGTERQSRDTRRRTDGHGSARQEGGTNVSNAQAIELPVTRLQKHRQEQDANEDVAAGEEFAPEEQLELELVQSGGQGSTAVAPRRKKRAKSGVAKAAPWSVLVALLGGIATVWRQEKLQVGYCGVGEASTALAGVQIPEWAAFIQPQCEPCPQHAYCYSDLKTVCEPDFVLTPHPMSLQGLVPLPPTCEPDSEKVRRIKQVADFAVDTELRERNAQYECGEISSPDVAEEDLKATVSAKRSKRMTDEEFDELWTHALGEIVGRDEVVSEVDGKHADRRLLRSSSLARISLACAVRRSLRQSLRQHLPKLVALIALSLSAVYGRHALTLRRSTASRAKQLAGSTLDKLATQASLHATDPAAYPEPWVGMVALRDDVLRDEFSAKERTRLWDVVRSLVEGNANVRTMVREGRTGDVSRVWEWIGAVQRLESPESARRRSSGSRVSLGRLAGSPSQAYLSDGRNEQDSPSMEMGGVKKWDENRSYY